MERFKKQPSERLDFAVDGREWFKDISTDSVASQVVSVELDYGTEESPSLTVETTDIFSQSVLHWISGGAAEHDYKITTIITTTEGREKEHEFIIKVRDQ